MTPEFRRDPLHNTWVVFAPERQRRPNDFAPTVLQTGTLDPFAEGNERLTPPEVYAVRKEKTKPNEPGWRVLVVPNRYPAMRVEGQLEAAPVGLYDRLTGIGAHEVIIETPNADLALEDLAIGAIADIFASYRERIIDLDKDQRFQHIYIFKNVGPSAGASLVHAHSQLVALPLVPRLSKASSSAPATTFFSSSAASSATSSTPNAPTAPAWSRKMTATSSSAPSPAASRLNWPFSPSAII